MFSLYDILGRRRSDAGQHWLSGDDQLGELGGHVDHRHFGGVQAVTRREHGADVAKGIVGRLMNNRHELIALQEN